MVRMFCKAKHFNHDISNWDVSEIRDMREMFSGCENFNQPLDRWNVFKVENMYNMFVGCGALENLPQWYKEWCKKKSRKHENDEDDN